MFIKSLTIKDFRQFGGSASGLAVEFSNSVTALVGQNDSGKTTIIDALRYALTTRDSEYLKVQPEDFYVDKSGQTAQEFSICCKLVDLSVAEQGALLEHLTYEAGSVVVYIHLLARRLSDFIGARRSVDVQVRSGATGNGASFESNLRQLLAAAYLKPLRDADREMAAGRGSRLSQILGSFPKVKDGKDFDSEFPPNSSAEADELSIPGVADYVAHLVDRHPGIVEAEKVINEDYLSSLYLSGEKLHGGLSFAPGGSKALCARVA